MGIQNAMQGVQAATSKATALLGPLNMALGVIGAGLSLDKMLDIGSAFENQSIKMAQTAKLMGMGGETFADAMEVAKNMITQVNVAAAALPGEAEDYSTALEMAGFTVMRATGDYQKSFELIKDITAITISNGRNSAEAANQLNKMLNAERGLMELGNDYSMKLLQNMRALPGYANLTMTEFNKMKLEERVKLVSQLSGQFKDMLDASAGTLDAIKGASMTIFKEITRNASAPLFDAWKEGLAGLNALLMQSNGSLTPLGNKIVFIGQVLSEKVVGAVKSLATMDLSEIGTLAGSLASLGTGGMGLASFFSPLILFGQTLGKLAMDVDFTDSVFQSLTGILTTLEPLGAMFASLLDMSTSRLAGFISGVLPSALDALLRISQPLVWFAGELTNIVNILFTQLTPVFEALWVKVSIFLQGVADFVVPALMILGKSLLWLWDLIDGPLIGGFKGVIRILGALFEYVGKFLSWAGANLNAMMGLQETNTDMKEREPSMLEKLLQAFKTPEGSLTAPKAPKTPDKRAVTGVVQDFKFSRFQIDQKFEEGYDPDRIAVAFANDLGKIGQQRSQSGFAPLFSVGI
jgi:hypothetical protein